MVEYEECYGKRVLKISVREWISVLTNSALYQRVYGVGKRPDHWELMSLKVFERGLRENVLLGHETFCEAIEKLKSQGLLERWLKE